MIAPRVSDPDDTTRGQTKRKLIAPAFRRRSNIVPAAPPQSRLVATATKEAPSTIPVVAITVAMTLDQAMMRASSKESQGAAKAARRVRMTDLPMTQHNCTRTDRSSDQSEVL